MGERQKICQKKINYLHLGLSESGFLDNKCSILHTVHRLYKKFFGGFVMKEFFVKSVRSDMEEYAMCCGPMTCDVLSEALVKTAEEEFYFGLLEVSDIPTFYKTTESLFEKILEANDDEHELEELFHCSLDYADYNDMFSDRDSEYYDLCRYLTYIVRSDLDRFETFRNAQINQYVSKIDIPTSDVEDSYQRMHTGEFAKYFN